MIMLIEILKLARPRTWFFAILSYAIGYLLSRGVLSFTVIVGFIVYIIWVAGVNLINAYTDIKEDKVNLPHRYKMVKNIGYKKVFYISLLLFSLTSIVTSFMPMWFLITYLIAVFIAIFYSMPPLRFKSRSIIGMIVFCTPVLFPLIGTWSLFDSIYNIPSIIFFLGYWFITYGTIKNLPDYEGDKKIGIKNSATMFSTRKEAVNFAVIILLSPFLILPFLILSNFIELKFILLFLWLPLIAIICSKALKAKNFETLEKLHTYGLIYAVGFLSLTVLIVSFTFYSLIFLVLALFILFLILKTKFDSR